MDAIDEKAPLEIPIKDSLPAWPKWLKSVVGLALLAVAVWAGLAWQRSRRAEVLPISLSQASSKEDKAKLAQYLNRHVRLKGFSVEVHPVELGESYWSIASDYSIRIDTIVGCNPELTDIYAKKVGYPLLVPSLGGVLHQVTAGETLDAIGTHYSLSATAIAEANRISWMGLSPGQVLFVPGAKPKDFTAPMAKLYSDRQFLRSPLGGAYTSFVGVRSDPFTGEKKHHNGVDIRAPLHTPIGAAADGVVEFAGISGGYGKCVILRHARGYRTLYGHMERIYVHRGQKVKQHQFLGRVGMTGRTTGPHLHFTVWVGNKLQNPMKYLW
jgi:LysM repeat protein